MEWFEFIRLSTTAERARELSRTLADMARELRTVPGVRDCVVLRHAMYDGDVALVLVHRDLGGTRETREALCVADHLRNYGLVDHQAWSLVDTGGLCLADTESSAAACGGEEREPPPPVSEGARVRAEQDRPVRPVGPGPEFERQNE